MKYAVYAALLFAARAAVASAAHHDAPPPPLIIERHTVIRVRTFAALEEPRPIEWKEHKGPKCIRLDMLAGAAISQPDSVDLVLRGGAHLRARLEKGCSSENFYSGFYLKPTSDGQICVKRDMFHARIGGDCAIIKFRSLEGR